MASVMSSMRISRVCCLRWRRSSHATRPTNDPAAYPAGNARGTLKTHCKVRVARRRIRIAARSKREGRPPACTRHTPPGWMLRPARRTAPLRLPWPELNKSTYIFSSSYVFKLNCKLLCSISISSHFIRERPTAFSGGWSYLDPQPERGREGGAEDGGGGERRRVAELVAPAQCDGRNPPGRDCLRDTPSAGDAH
eukprot:6528485-Pyramimonas_sp.AAC.1